MSSSRIFRRLKAKSDLPRASWNVPGGTPAEAKERLARITALTDDSAFGLNMNYLYTDRLTQAELGEPLAAGMLEVAESKKKVLLEYTKEKTTEGTRVGSQEGPLG